MRDYSLPLRRDFATAATGKDFEETFLCIIIFTFPEFTFSAGVIFIKSINKYTFLPASGL